MTKADRAKELFLQGYNCAQAVAGAFCQEMGMPLEVCVKAVSGYGGGMGRLREVCGGFSGAVFVLSVLTGYADAEDTEGKKALYERIRLAADMFRERNGSIICRELLGGIPAGGDPDLRTKEYYKKRPCVELVGDAAEITERILQKNGVQHD